MGERPGRVRDVDQQAGRHVGERVVEPRQLRRRERVVRLVGDGEMGEHTDQLDRRGPLLDRRDDRGDGVRMGPDALHAGVDLEMDRQPIGLVRRRAHRGTRRVYTVGVKPCSTIVRGRFGRLLGQHEDRCVDAGLAQLDAFGDTSATHRPSRSGRERGSPDRDRAVAVAVGLDDRPHRGRGDGGPQHLDVVRDRVEIDLGPRPTARRTFIGRDRPWRSADRAARRSCAGSDRRCRRRRRPARQSPSAPPRRAPMRPSPRPATVSTPDASIVTIMPASTSPVPAVASRSSPRSTTSTSPVGSATTVVGPFSSTVHPSRRRQPSGGREPIGRGGAPVSSEYSPSCGVRTVGAGPARSAAGRARRRSTRRRRSRHRRRRSAASHRRSAGGSTSIVVSRPAESRARPPARRTGRCRRAPAPPSRWRRSAAGSPRRDTSPPHRARQRDETRTAAQRRLRAAARRHRASTCCRRRRAPRRSTCAPIDRPSRPPRRDVAGLDEVGGGPRRVEPDVDDLDLARTAAGPTPISIPGLSAWNVTVRSAANTRTGASPVAASRPLGMSTASTACPPTSGASTTRGTCRDSRCRRPHRSRGRRTGAPVGTGRRRRTPRPTRRARRSHSAADAAVGAVVARTGDDVDDPRP